MTPALKGGGYTESDTAYVRWPSDGKYNIRGIRELMLSTGGFQKELISDFILSVFYTGSLENLQDNKVSFSGYR